jgi:hypothetical protein
MTYAENTTVGADKSRAEIERTLRRYGADAFSYAWDGDRAMVGFRAFGRAIKFEVVMPPLADFRYSSGATYKPRAVERSEEQMREHQDKAMRQRWRALALVIKAKLEAVESGISVFEEEFLAHIVLPNGKTVGQWMAPQVAQAYETGEMPRLMLSAGEE